jgi:translation elongation factor EF-Tu-like GTPase
LTAALTTVMAAKYGGNATAFDGGRASVAIREGGRTVGAGVVSKIIE